MISVVWILLFLIFPKKDLPGIPSEYNQHYVYRVSSGLDPDQTQYFVGSALLPVHLQMLSADNNSCHLQEMITEYIVNTRWVSFDIKFTRQGFENISGKLDNKRREPGILIISLPIVSLFKLA